MKSKRPVVIASVLMTLLSPAEPLLFPNNAGAYDWPRQEAQDPPQASDQNEVKTYPGRITRSNGQFMLQDQASSNAYLLDDQKAAKKYDGKMVLVTGILDRKTNTIRVKKIQARPEET